MVPAAAVIADEEEARRKHGMPVVLGLRFLETISPFGSFCFFNFNFCLYTTQEDIKHIIFAYIKPKRNLKILFL